MTPDRFEKELNKIQKQEPITDYSDYTTEQLASALDTAIIGKNATVIRQIAALTRPDTPNLHTLLKTALTKQHWSVAFTIQSALNMEPYQLTQGPLPKSKHTADLEHLCRLLMRGEAFEWVQLNNEDHIQIAGASFNWSALAKYANFEHIDLNQDDFALYKAYLVSSEGPHGNERPELFVADEARYRAELYATYLEQRWPLPEPVISFQEMEAINVYTGSFYKTINTLLRDELNVSGTPKHTVRAAIINAVMCASGLRRIPQTNITEAERMGSFKPRVHAAYVQAAATHGVVLLSGFISTSVGKTTFETKGVHFHFSRLKGAYIAPISQHPEENEFLIPPTQVQLTHYEYIKNKHHFNAQAVSDVHHYPMESLEPLSLANAYEEPSSAHAALPKITSLTQTMAWDDLIKSIDDFMFYIQHVDADAQANIMQCYHDNWNELIHSSYDFAAITHALNADQQRTLLQQFLPDLNALITNGYAVETVLQYLSDESKTTVFDALEAKWLPLITDAYELTAILHYLTPEQTTRVCDVSTERWRVLIKTSDDFKAVVEHLPPTQQAVVCRAFTETWADLIHSPYDFASVIKHLDATQRGLILNAIQSSEHMIINTAKQFQTVTQHLDVTQSDIVFAIFKSSLMKSITSEGSYLTLLSALSATQAAEMHQLYLHHHTDGFIPSEQTLHRLPTTHQTAIYKARLNETHPAADPTTSTHTPPAH